MQAGMQRLELLAAFAPRLRDAKSQFGAWQPMSGDGTSQTPYTLPWYSLSELGQAFYEMVYEAGWILDDFDWPTWVHDHEGWQLANDRAALSNANEQQLANLLTALVRHARFFEGALSAAYDSGLILAIAERAQTLCRGSVPPGDRTHDSSTQVTGVGGVVSKETQYRFLVSEADVDLILAEEFASNSIFRSWFLSVTGAASAPNEPPAFIGRSVSTHHGESDVLIIHPDGDGKKRAILVENKISAPPTKIQSERYLIRGKKGIDDQDWDTFVTVLIAPEKYLTHTTMEFNCEVSYESLLAAFGDDQSDLRAMFKRRLIERALKQAKNPFTQIVDPALTAWFVDARRFGISEFPDLPLPEEGQGRAPTSTWIVITLGAEFVMSRVAIEIKPHRGHVDLRFKDVLLGEMRRAFFGRLPARADTVVAKTAKSCAVRLVYPPANLRLPFETQKHLVRPMMAGADSLLKLAIAEKATIMNLLGYGEFSDPS